MASKHAEGLLDVAIYLESQNRHHYAVSCEAAAAEITRLDEKEKWLTSELLKMWVGYLNDGHQIPLEVAKVEAARVCADKLAAYDEETAKPH